MRSAMVRGAGAVGLALACVTAAGPIAQAETSRAAAPSSQDLDLTNNGFDNKTSSLKFVRP
jgi:hypothetical protein